MQHPDDEPEDQPRSRRRPRRDDDYDDGHDDRPRRSRDRRDDYDEYDDRPRRNMSRAEVDNYCMLMHLSQFIGYLVPLAGLIAPIVMWQIRKDDSPRIDQHGKDIVNWMISLILYVTISIVLIVVFVGIALLLVLMVLAIVFPIIAGVKASNGQRWPYPLTITFIP